jgi:hypothetical protein
LDELKETIRQLRWNLECALERVRDAEEGAIALLAENDEIYRQAKLTAANIANLQQQLIKAKRGSVISFGFGAVSFGAGVPLVMTGIMTDNQTMLYTGAGITAGTGAIWALGHFVFGWW